MLIECRTLADIKKLQKERRRQIIVAECREFLDRPITATAPNGSPMDGLKPQIEVRVSKQWRDGKGKFRTERRHDGYAVRQLQKSNADFIARNVYLSNRIKEAEEKLNVPLDVIRLAAVACAGHVATISNFYPILAHDLIRSCQRHKADLKVVSDKLALIEGNATPDPVQPALTVFDMNRQRSIIARHHGDADVRALVGAYLYFSSRNDWLEGDSDRAWIRETLKKVIPFDRDAYYGENRTKQQIQTDSEHTKTVITQTVAYIESLTTEVSVQTHFAEAAKRESAHYEGELKQCQKWLAQADARCSQKGLRLVDNMIELGQNRRELVSYKLTLHAVIITASIMSVILQMH